MNPVFEIIALALVFTALYMSIKELFTDKDLPDFEEFVD